MNIRPFKRGDENAVCAIMAEHSVQFPKFKINKYIQRWNECLSKDEMDYSAYYVVTNHEGKVIGHAGYFFNEELGMHEIVGVAVKKSWQRLGVGKILLDTICDSLAQLGKSKVMLYTLDLPDTGPALSFYKELGFDTIKYEENFYIPGYHRITLLKSLINT